jgi:hypothetical protein
LCIPYSKDLTKEGDGVTLEFAFLHFHKKLFLQEALEDLSELENVFLG